jgi:hypothetical protein
VTRSNCLKENCNRIARTFGRPVTGIYNPTLGLIGDIIECIIQRSFSYNTYCTRYSYDYIKARLADPSVKKVVLISHSQGGIIVSMVLDLLFADMPVENIAKLEVYTFGCAASHFNNPLRAIDPNSHTPRARVIPYIEHYANSEDMVTRWGVLYNVCTAPSNSFMGKVFIRRDASGHLLNQHYLSKMFPLPEEQADSEAGTKFLDQIVDVHEQLTRWQESFGKRNCPSFCRTSSYTYGSFTESEDFTQLKNTNISQLEREAALDALYFVRAGDGVPDGRPVEHRPAGKTVREVSRLWRYMGGLSPDRLELPPIYEGYDSRVRKNSGSGV